VVHNIKVESTSSSSSSSSEAALVLLASHALRELTELTVADIWYQPGHGLQLEQREGAPLLSITCDTAPGGAPRNQAPPTVPVGICNLQINEQELPGMGSLPLLEQAGILAQCAAQQSSSAEHAAIYNIKEFKDAPADPGVRNAVMHTLQAAQRMPQAGPCIIQCSSGSMEVHPDPRDLRGLAYAIALRIGVSSNEDLAAIASAILSMASTAADKVEGMVPEHMRPPNAARKLALLGRNGSIVMPEDISSSTAPWGFATVKGVPLGFLTERERAGLSICLFRSANPQTMAYVVSAAVT
jgi:hypothetical protein